MRRRFNGKLTVGQVKARFPEDFSGGVYGRAHHSWERPYWRDADITDHHRDDDGEGRMAFIRERRQASTKGPRTNWRYVVGPAKTASFDVTWYRGDDEERRWGSKEFDTLRDAVAFVNAGLPPASASRRNPRKRRRSRR